MFEILTNIACIFGIIDIFMGLFILNRIINRIFKPVSFKGKLCAFIFAFVLLSVLVTGTDALIPDISKKPILFFTACLSVFILLIAIDFKFIKHRQIPIKKLYTKIHFIRKKKQIASLDEQFEITDCEGSAESSSLTDTYLSADTEQESARDISILEEFQKTDPLLIMALKVFYINKEYGMISTSTLQRKLRLGYSKAAQIIDKLTDYGYIRGSNPLERVLLLNEAEIEFITNFKQKDKPDSAPVDTVFPSYSNSSTVHDLLNVVDNMTTDGELFEKFCCLILEANDFSKVKTTKYSGDYGVDILAEKEGITYAIQCKCYSDKVGNKAVQEAYSGKSFYNCMVAAVLTNNYFTNAAVETAKANNVLLWDRDKLSELIDKYTKSKD